LRIETHTDFTEIVNQTFQGQEIPLDGYIYIGCTFADVKFVYNNGETGGFDPTCKVGGNFGFKSRDPYIQQMLFFLVHLHFMHPPINGRYTPILGDLPNPNRTSWAITSEQFDVIGRVLRGTTGSIQICHRPDYEIAERYAEQLKRAFRRAGIAAEVEMTEDIPRDLIGLVFRVAHPHIIPERAQRYADVLKQADIECRFEALARRTALKEQEFELLIGKQP
jgi:hypothetical protein